ncbi:prolyl oligopeptidase family serine peptidase [Azospirillum brasilense]|uniref:alpha/beta hydrolase family protein n=1 Tax=Azospirillum brasilense TaxID=192 RepID=UPI00190ACBD1|nr:prolyl oligopeptidase family serine peptidase [Azospirillum brasilense]MBK3733292.1 prolyl oligopeptidase family serine peptidase [Azospirillum brasilense]
MGWMLVAGVAVLWAGAAAAEVGMRALAFTDPADGGIARAVVWYPTDAPETPVRRGPFAFRVAEGGPLTEGRHPLVMLSHGSGGSAFGHADTAMALARRGYVVAAVHHRGNAFDGDRDAGTERMWRNRPAQLSAALDHVLADPDLAGRIDGDRVGAFGFSSGGYTVLVAAGGVAELGRIADHCLTPPTGERFCHLGNEETSARVEARDPRIRAAVLAAPVGVPFSKDGLAGVTIPMRLYRAERDEQIAASQVEGVRDRLPTPPEYEVVGDAGHFAFLMPVPAAIAAEVGPPAQDSPSWDPPGFDRAAFHERLNTEIADFFDRALAIGRQGR